ncbi:hypothetical protein CR513_44358, partial [Mucuna pruriens]
MKQLHPAQLKGSQVCTMAKNFAKKLGVMLVVAVVVMVVLVAQPAECVFIPLNPCTLAECTERCKEIMKGDFAGASCTTTPTGQICLCLG